HSGGLADRKAITDLKSRQRCTPILADYNRGGDVGVNHTEWLFVRPDCGECRTLARARSARSLSAWQHGSMQGWPTTTQISKKIAKISSNQQLA
ncbi:unnamed protein product, partial [Ceratitis capitata]